MIKERTLRDYIINKLTECGWKYVDPSELERPSLDKPLLSNILRRKIREFNRGVCEEDISEAISILESRSYGPKGAREVIEYLKFGVPVRLRTRTSARLYLIDYNNIWNNEFIISSEVKHIGKRERRNDILLYVNGIPLVSIEVKDPTDPEASWYKAFRQIKQYEQDIPELYKYVQIGVAVEAVAKYFPIVPWAKDVQVYEWKEGELDSVDSTIEMLRPEKLLDILRYFLYFRIDEGRETKVIARYMQYRAANKIVERVIKRLRGEHDIDRGLIWHWQGSGKTLTMIFAAMKLYWLLKDPMIFFVVDRVDLQNQLYYENLTKLDLGPEVKPKLITSIDHLKQVLSYKDFRGQPGIFVVTIQKFLPKEFDELEKLLNSVAGMEHTIVNRKDIIVLIDEAHRTQYGVLADQMMRLLKNANYFAFTGTPIPRKIPTKNTFAKFSPPGELYLDKYFITDSIEDGYTVKIAYQPGPFDYKLDKELLIDFLESEFEELPEEIKISIERKIGKELDIKKFRIFLEDPSRIDKIAEYIAKHFKEYVDGKFKAMVVATSRKACVLYKRALDKYLDSRTTEVVMTFKPQEEESLIEEYKNELKNRYKVTDPKDAISKIIENYKNEEYPKIIIVTDMLLTGFDAPILQTMYLDKPLKGAKLLQTIARVNRPYEGKEYGLVIDFVGIFDELEKAFAMYEKEDLKGAVYKPDDILNNFREVLKDLLNLIGDIPKVEDDKQLLIYLKNKVIEIMSDKELEIKFVEGYRLLRRLYELISPKLSREEHDKYRLLSEIYVYYTKLVSPEDELMKKYYKKTMQAISNALKVINKDVEFTPITIDKEFFKKFIEDPNIDVSEKASALLLGLTRFRLYARNDPVYISLADKIEKLLESWRKKLKLSYEYYEEAKRLWEEIYRREEEKSKLGEREFLIYYALIEAGFDKEKAMAITKEIMENIRDKINVPGWENNPKLLKEIEKAIAEVIFREIRKISQAKRLIETIVERVKEIGLEG